MASAQARGISLTGMWFSPGSLAFGVLGALWDSSKLLDLPDEVKDAPFVPHRVGCPKCHHAAFDSAGTTTCEACQSPYLILSCTQCGSVHTIQGGQDPQGISINCRNCGRASAAPSPARNTPKLLFGQAFAEVASLAGISMVEFQRWCRVLCEGLELTSRTEQWLTEHFGRPRKRNADALVLVQVLKTGRIEFLIGVLSLASNLTTSSQWPALRKVIASCGLDPGQFTPGSADDDQDCDWQAVLGVGPDVTMDQIRAAYQRLARQLHPDGLVSATEGERRSAHYRMQEINAAYERAKVIVEARDKSQQFTADRRNESPVSGNAPSPPEKSTVVDPNPPRNDTKPIASEAKPTAQPAAKSSQLGPAVFIVAACLLLCLCLFLVRPETFWKTPAGVHSDARDSGLPHQAGEAIFAAEKSDQQQRRRVWTSKDGNFKADAIFLRRTGTLIELWRVDTQKLIVVDQSLLDAADIGFIDSWTDVDPSKPVAPSEQADQQQRCRVWTSKDGNFKADAIFLRRTNNLIELWRPDSQKLIVVEESQLAPSDVDFINKLEKGPEAEQPKTSSRTDMAVSMAPTSPNLPPSRVDPFECRTLNQSRTRLSTYGGNVGTELAVQHGLLWLKRNQLQDGSWSLTGPFTDGASVDNRVAATAMALIAFQGAGNTHQTGTHKDVVERGWTALKRMQDEQGFFVCDAAHHHRTYAQAQATIAACELYGMSKDEQYRSVAQKAIDFAVDSQDPHLGGWRYEPKQDSDTSVTAWFIEALHSGEMAGLSIPGQTKELARAYLDRAQVSGGSRYAYKPGMEATLTMTACGLLGRQYLGWGADDERLVPGLDYLGDNKVDYTDANTYYWYHATLAAFHRGGEHWKRWNNAMVRTLPQAQIATGDERGSWSPSGDRWGTHGGRLFVTCMHITTLEVYYRHPPLCDD